MSRWHWRQWTQNDRLFALIAVSVLTSVLALGGSRTSWMLASAPIPVVAGIVGVWGWAGRLPGPALAMLTLALYCVLQAIPFPPGVLEAIAPANAGVWEQALSGFSDPARAWTSLSLDPGASWIEAFKWTLYAGLLPRPRSTPSAHALNISRLRSSVRASHSWSLG